MVTRNNVAKVDGNNFKAVILGDIEAVKNNWSVVHNKLSVLSRSLLQYIPDTGDIGMLNRLLDAMSGARGRRNHQRDIIVMYFSNFLEWKYDDKTGQFTSKLTGAGIVARRVNNRTVWLKKESNDIWVWADENVKRPERHVDYIAGVGNAVNRALDKEKNAEYFGNHSKSDAIAAIMRQVFAAGGMDECMKAATELYGNRDKSNLTTTKVKPQTEPAKSEAPARKPRAIKDKQPVAAE